MDLYQGHEDRFLPVKDSCMEEGEILAHDFLGYQGTFPNAWASICTNTKKDDNGTDVRVSVRISVFKVFKRLRLAHTKHEVHVISPSLVTLL